MLEKNKKNIWQEVNTVNLSLAPMEDVTDTVFRQLILESMQENKLHFLFAEFTSVDGMCHAVGHDKVKHRLFISDAEKKLLKEKNVKLIAQIWGNDPEKFYKTAKYIAQETDFDGIDINMGCPVKNVVKNGCCSALIDQAELAKEIIIATREASNLSLSVKTRIGFKTVITESWISHLLNTPIDAITLHGRIQSQMSEGIADWDEIAKAVDLRNKINPNIKIIGNGDIKSYDQAVEYAKKYGVDGAMIGRGIFTNPWFFNPQKEEISKEDKLSQLLRHTNIFVDTWGETKNFAILKRYFKIYTSGFRGASALRNELMTSSSRENVIEIIKKYQ